MRYPWQKKVDTPPEAGLSEPTQEEQMRKMHTALTGERPRVLFYPGKVVEVEGLKFRITEAKNNGRLYLKLIK